MKKAFYFMLLAGMALVLASVTTVSAEEELVIVKYGKLTVKSPVPEAKVYIDDEYKGPADTVIEDIIVGEHSIVCRTDSQSAKGRFQIRKDETLKLEANYEQGQLIEKVEKQEKVEKAEKPERVEKAEKPEPEKKVKVEVHRPEKPKKPVVVAETRKEEKKNPAEERRELHLSIVKVFFEDTESQEVQISCKVNPKVVGKFTEKKNQTGTYYRTKKNVLLCDAGPCVQQWATSFTYTDETAKNDTFGVTWKQTVFNGITPTGTSKRDLLFCVNGACNNLEEPGNSDKPIDASIGRYHVSWRKSSLVVRRSDLEKEVTDAGGSVEAY